MSKRDVLNFAPGGEKKRRNVPVFAGVIVVICLVLFAASVFVILAVNDFDIGKALGARDAENESVTEETGTAEEESLTGEAVEAAAVNFLVLCSDSRELTFCQLVSVDAARSEIKIKPLPSDYMLDTDSGKIALGALFGKASYQEIGEAFIPKGIRVSRYVHVTEDNFKRIMSNIGQVPVQINGYYEFNIDAVKYTFSPGVQNMTSDTLLKFMKYAASGEEMLRIQSNAVADIFRQHFTKENFEKGESFFSKIINYVDSDITAFDYNAVKGVIEKMTSSEVKISVVS